MYWWPRISSAILPFFAASLLRAATVEFIPLGDFPEGVFVSAASTISADGTTVAGAGSRYELSRSTSDAFRWTVSTGLVNLQTAELINSPQTSAASVSGNGDVVVGYTNYSRGPRNFQAFRWTSSEGIVDMGYLPGASLFLSAAAGVSTDGKVIVGYSDSANGPNEAFRWTFEDGMIGLGDLDGGEFASQAYAVSMDGKTIVGIAGTDIGGEAFRWTAETGMARLAGDQAGFVGTRARDLSSDGGVIVGDGFSPSSVTTLEAFRWTDAGGIQPLGDLPGGYFFSEASAVSGDGSIVVGVSNRDNGGTAFVWDAFHGMRDLQMVLAENYSIEHQIAGWRLTYAADISEDGLSIVGTGINPDGNTEAWLVRLDRPLTAPEPSSLALLLTVAALLATDCPGSRQMQFLRRDRS